MPCHFARQPRQQQAVACCAMNTGCPRIGVCLPSFFGAAGASRKRNLPRGRQPCSIPSRGCTACPAPLSESGCGNSSVKAAQAFAHKFPAAVCLSLCSPLFIVYSDRLFYAIRIEHLFSFPEYDILSLHLIFCIFKRNEETYGTDQI